MQENVGGGGKYLSAVALVLLALGGCLDGQGATPTEGVMTPAPQAGGATKSPGVDPTSASPPMVEPTSATGHGLTLGAGGTNLSLDLLTNSTVLIPIELDRGTFVEGRATYLGPKSSGFTLAYFPEGGPSDSNVYLRVAWDAPEYSRLKEAGPESYREMCWSGAERLNPTDSPCPGRDYTQSFDWERNVESIQLPPGRGYLFVEARFDSGFVLNLAFTKRISIGQETVEESRVVRLGMESFEAADERIERCGEIFWCGDLAGGVWTFPADVEFVVYLVDGYLSPGAIGEHCVEGGTAPRKCADLYPVNGGFLFSLATTLTPGTPTTKATLEINGLPPTGLANPPGHFSLRGLVHQIALPSTHPLA